MSDEIVVRYIGDGRRMVGIPPRDMTQVEVDALSVGNDVWTVERLCKTLLYEKAQPAVPTEEKPKPARKPRKAR